MSDADSGRGEVNLHIKNKSGISTATEASATASATEASGFLETHRGPWT